MPKKFTDLTLKTTAASTDVVAIVDVSAGSSKKTTVAGLAPGVASSLADNAIQANALATNAIALGYSERNSIINTSSTSVIDLTSLSTTVTVPAGGRRCRISVYLPVATNASAANNAVNFYIREGSTTLQTARSNVDIGKSVGPINLSYSAVLSAGSHTYKASASLDVAASTDLSMSATSLGYILVEAI